MKGSHGNNIGVLSGLYRTTTSTESCYIKRPKC
jgi:hypothetical protein